MQQVGEILSEESILFYGFSIPPLVLDDRNIAITLQVIAKLINRVTLSEAKGLKSLIIRCAQNDSVRVLRI